MLELTSCMKWLLLTTIRRVLLCILAYTYTHSFPQPHNEYVLFPTSHSPFKPALKAHTHTPLSISRIRGQNTHSNSLINPRSFDVTVDGRLIDRNANAERHGVVKTFKYMLQWCVPISV